MQISSENRFMSKSKKTGLVHAGKPCKIKLKIKVLAEMTEDDELFISGNIPELGDWDPAGICLEPVEENEYEIEFSANTGTIVECKITRGCWKTQGIFSKKDIPPNNLAFKICRDRTISVKIVEWLDRLKIKSDPVVGELITHRDIPCPGLKYPRNIQVWLPEGYESSSEEYSVLYMHDGQNLFEPKQSFGGVDWKVDETASRLMKTDEIQNLIVVAIPNSPDRMQELNLFTRKGKAYAKYLVNEVKPFIDEHYRTRKSPEFTGIMGSSMGGLMSFQMTCAYPGVFGLAGCISPAFPKTYGKIFQQLHKKNYVPKNVKIYLDTGEYEPPIVITYFQMLKELKTKGFSEGKNLLGFFDASATHTESAWASRLHIPLSFLFPPQK